MGPSPAPSPMIITVLMMTIQIISVPQARGQEPDVETDSSIGSEKVLKDFHGIDKPNMITTAHIHDLLFQPMYIYTYKE